MTNQIYKLEVMESLKCCGNCEYYEIDKSCPFNNFITNEPWEVCYDWVHDSLTREQRLGVA